ncbi:hypothetical protein [Ketobacter sp.]|uniref:hypothetical protein n=1 Tax=Ketobacter sp. TaxID=2083498 RepID=UPI0025B8ED6E|nr:hypothetical protein [Ketobacter sp.]
MTGDTYGLDIPAHPDALLKSGAAFLNRAFQHAASIHATGNASRSIESILDSQIIHAGSTGTKLLLTVEIAAATSRKKQRLFVKFSRDFSNEIRDASRQQMALEIRFAQLSQLPQFPIVVPTCYFADFQHRTGTGLMITECIPYGEGDVEPQRPKAMDYRLGDSLPYYRALIRNLARLAAASKNGSLRDEVERQFPFQPEQLDVGPRRALQPGQLEQNVDRYAQFCKTYPGLIPAHLRSAEFLARFRRQACQFQHHQPHIHALLQSEPDMIALCHWNAHVDNAWFWREPSGALECGLLDWGNVSQMNVAMALWGCLSGAELDLWNEHLDGLLHLFIATYQAGCGVQLDIEQLKRHLNLYMGSMGLSWLLRGPIRTLSGLEGLNAASTRTDPIIERNEPARSQLHLMQVFLNHWSHSDMAV